MKFHSRTTKSFRLLYGNLNKTTKLDARKAYALFKIDPSHPGLQFKCVNKKAKVYSVRVNINFRALGTLDGDEIIWMWIGSHKDYEKLI
jgi:hypothetical protein